MGVHGSCINRIVSEIASNMHLQEFPYRLEVEITPYVSDRNDGVLPACIYGNVSEQKMHLLFPENVLDSPRTLTKNFLIAQKF